MFDETLVLDQAFQAIDRKSWQDAMVDWANGKVEVIATYPDRVVHRGREIYMPSVVRFTEPLGPRRRKVKFSRDNIYLRDRGTCQYCSTKVGRDSFTFDHVTPRDLGGTTCWENIVVACSGCNTRKRNRTPEAAGMHLRKRPVRPRSLPPKEDPRLMWKDGLPVEWRPYLRDTAVSHAYWHEELEP